MAKNKLSYYMKVGVHLLLIGIVAGIIAWLINLPVGLLLGMFTIATGAIVAGISLIIVVEFIIACLVGGYFVVKWKKWLFKDSWV